LLLEALFNHTIRPAERHPKNTYSPQNMGKTLPVFTRFAKNHQIWGI
jgi:hypothetical protein